MGALLVATVTTGWRSRPDPTLIDISHAIGSIDSKKQTWDWLSAQELIVVTTDTEPDNLLGAVSDEIHWQGHVELWNVSTGKRRRLSGLTTLLNRGWVTPYEIPASFTLSPNRTWLVWHNHQSQDGWPFPAAAHLDGTHFREWNSDTRGYGFFLDDQHWVEHDVSKWSSVHIVDLADKRKDRKYPAAAPQAKAILALHAVQQPHFVHVDFSDQKHVVEIATYRTKDWAAFDRSLHDHRYQAPHPLSKSTLKLPSGTNLFRFGGEASPDQSMVLYHLHTEHTNPVLAFQHRILPKVSATHVDTESLWVSKADGQGFHEIGHVVVPHHSKEDGEKEELSGVEWIPGSKQVAFVYHKRLYVVPVK